MTPHGDEFATFHNAAMAAQARDLYNAVRNGQQHAGLRKPWFEFRNAADESQPVEILIYDQIGKDWRGGGISAREFVEGLKQIPTNRKILLTATTKPFLHHGHRLAGFFLIQRHQFLCVAFQILDGMGDLLRWSVGNGPGCMHQYPGAPFDADLVGHEKESIRR